MLKFHWFLPTNGGDGRQVVSGGHGVSHGAGGRPASVPYLGQVARSVPRSGVGVVTAVTGVQRLRVGAVHHPGQSPDLRSVLAPLRQALRDAFAHPFLRALQLLLRGLQRDPRGMSGIGGGPADPVADL